MNDTELLGFLADANAYQDDTSIPERVWTHDVALREIDRRIEMQTQTKPDSASESPRRPRGWLVAVAVFALVLMVGIAALTLARSGDSEPASPTTSIPLEGADGDAAAAEAFGPVEAAYAAHHAGDTTTVFEAWFPPQVRGEVGFWRDVFMDAGRMGERIEIHRCVSHGFGDWPGIGPIEPFVEEGVSSTGYRFECEVTMTNTFHGAGGIELVSVHEWVINDGVHVATIFRPVSGEEEQAAFNLAFRDWLFYNQKALYDAQEVGFDLVPAGEESIKVALEYVRQFVEESAEWPLPDQGGA